MERPLQEHKSKADNSADNNKGNYSDSDFSNSGPMSLEEQGGGGGAPGGMVLERSFHAGVVRLPQGGNSAPEEGGHRIGGGG